MYVDSHVILAVDADGDELVHLLVDPRDGGVLLVAFQPTRIAQVFETADGVRVCAKIDVCSTTTVCTFTSIHKYIHTYIQTNKTCQYLPLHHIHTCILIHRKKRDMKSIVYICIRIMYVCMYVST